MLPKSFCDALKELLNRDCRIGIRCTIHPSTAKAMVIRGLIETYRHMTSAITRRCVTLARITDKGRAAAIQERLTAG